MTWGDASKLAFMLAICFFFIGANDGLDKKLDEALNQKVFSR